MTARYETTITIKVLHNNEIPKNFPRDHTLEGEFKEDLHVAIASFECFHGPEFEIPPSIEIEVGTKPIEPIYSSAIKAFAELLIEVPDNMIWAATITLCRYMEKDPTINKIVSKKEICDFLADNPSVEELTDKLMQMAAGN